MSMNEWFAKWPVNNTNVLFISLVWKGYIFDNFCIASTHKKSNEVWRQLLYHCLLQTDTEARVWKTLTVSLGTGKADSQKKALLQTPSSVSRKMILQR